MHFESLQEFINMGGHGLYVWTAYGITIVSLMLLAFFPISQMRKFFKNQN